MGQAVVQFNLALCSTGWSAMRIRMNESIGRKSEPCKLFKHKSKSEATSFRILTWISIKVMSCN